MPSIRLGNVAPLEAQVGTTVTVNDEVTASSGSVPLPGVESETLMVVPDELSLTDQLQQIGVVWKLHSSSDPAWVTGDDEFFVEAVSRNFDCPVGKPAGWGEETESEPEPAQEETE